MDESTLKSALAAMDGTVGFDAVIVCTSNPAQERYWQSRLEQTRGHAARTGSLILAVHEDWGGDGAGNGLGTLYAYTKASAKAQIEFSVDLDAKLKDGWSVAIYHTAGKGTRLAPIPGSENNNKPAAKLPALIPCGGEEAALTILEAVVRQTNAYAPLRPGRCSVFWGDQVFIPSAGLLPSPAARPADILACLGPMPTQQEWTERGLDKYGLIAVNDDGHAAQVEKVSHAVATSLLASFGNIRQVGPSLGSFSVSAALLLALLREFAPELAAKTAKLDSDPHLWMPFTLPEAAYVEVMAGKGTPAPDATAHYRRMQAFKSVFLGAEGGQAMLGCVDAGQSCYWWDYGLLRLYRKNNLLAVQASPEADALRAFLRVPPPPPAGPAALGAGGGRAGAEGDGASAALGCSLGGGKAEQSLLCRVSAPRVEVRECVLVNVATRGPIRGTRCVLYNVVDDSEAGLDLEEGTVRADVFMPGREKLVMYSSIDTDGGKAWKERLPCNNMSFEEVFAANAAVDVTEAVAIAAAARRSIATSP